MHHTPLARLTVLLVALVGSAGVTAAAVATVDEPASASTASVETTSSAVIDTGGLDTPAIVPVSAAPQQAATTTTTTAPPPTTTTTTTAPPAPPSTTTPPPPPPPVEPAPTTTAPAPTPAPAPAPAPTSTSMTACEREMLDHMNGARAARGTAPLAGDDRIVPISRRWSDELARLQDLQHNPDYGSQVFAARPEASRAGENVGRTHGSNAQLFQAFMESPGHRDAILAPGHTHAGVGCTVDSGGQLWVTVNFWG